jgi:cell wall-associated NlpC family hydrolase
MRKWQNGVGVVFVLAVLTISNGCTSVNRYDSTLTGAKVDGKQIVAISKTLIGAPYRFGGATPSGFDCSGLVRYVYNRLGIEVPHSSRMLYQKAKRVSLDRLQPGDLLFFKIDGKNVSHVAIYTQNSNFIHAPSSGKRVSIASLNSRYWSTRLTGAGRLR